MYNRYVRNDDGIYRRVPFTQTHTSSDGGTSSQHAGACQPEHGTASERVSPSAGRSRGKDSFLSGILSKFKLDEIDTGDLLLLVILFLLFRDGEDDEILIALGLLLIL